MMIESSEGRALNVEQVPDGCSDVLKGALQKIFTTNVYGHDSNWRQFVCCMFVDE